MNYTIIGQDGKKYGPARAEHIREWIAQGRVESRTPVFVEGMADWTFVGLLPEFASYFSGPPPAISGWTTIPAQVPRTNQLAVWGLICSVLAWVFCCCCIPFNILGLVLSIIALVQIRAHPENQEGKALAIAGIVLSAANLLSYAGLMILNILVNSAGGGLNFN